MNYKEPLQKIMLLLVGSICFLSLSLGLFSSLKTEASNANQSSIYTVLITESGFTPEVVTITVDTTVVWLNQTSTSQELNDCPPLPQLLHTIYIPLLLKNGPVTAKFTTQQTQAFSLTIPAGEDAQHLFDTPGTFSYCLTGLSGVTNTITVVEPDPIPTPELHMSINPLSQTITQTEKPVYLLHITSTDYYPYPITLSVTTAPSNTVSTLSQQVVYLPAQVSLELATFIDTPTGSHTIVVEGLSHDERQQVSANIVVNQASCALLPLAIHENVVDQLWLTGEGNIWNTLPGSNAKGWLKWNALYDEAPITYLSQMLTNPLLATTDFVDPTNNPDTILNAGDWIASLNGAVVSVEPEMDDLIGKNIVIPVWDTYYKDGTAIYYHITRFAQIQITSYNLPDSNRYINAIIINPDVPDICGGQSDLTIQEISLIPTQPSVNKPFSITATIQNQGVLSVTDPFTLNWYAVSTLTETGSINLPILLGQSLWVGTALEQNQMITLSDTFSLTQTGIYSFYAEIDSTDIIPEIDESNNLSPVITATIHPPFDMVMVVDKSGSMQFTPVCYGCWERTTTPDATETPPYNSYTTYPENGVSYPIGYSSTFTDVTAYACTTPSNPDFDVNQTVFEQDGYNHIIIEAELYSLNDTPPDPDTQVSGRGYWSLQRGESDYTNNSFISSQGTSVDDKGAHMAHHPSLSDFDGIVYGKHYTHADAQNGEAPGLHYKFHFYDGLTNEWDNDFYIWVRVHAGRGLHYASTSPIIGDNHPDGNDEAYWQVNTVNPDFPYTINNVGSIQHFEVSEAQNGTSGGNRNYWRWVRLDPTDSLNSSSTHLNNSFEFVFYAGSTGYSIDRIVITDNWDTTGSTNGSQPGGTGATLDYGNDTQDARLVPVTMDSAHWQACDMCNPIYGQNIVDPTLCPYHNLNQPYNNQFHALFNDWEMPMRGVKEAAKASLLSLDPHLDQVGLVTFSSTSTEKTELSCLRAGEIQGLNCVGSANALEFYEIGKTIEDTTSGGTTPTAGSLKAALEVLGFDPGNVGVDTNCDGNVDSSCARPNTEKIIILITDGTPTRTFGNSDDYGYNCTENNSPSWPPNNTANYRCPLLFAQEATANGVKIYVIAVGYSANQDYLTEIANQGNGTFFFAATTADVTNVMEDILNRNLE